MVQPTRPSSLERPRRWRIATNVVLQLLLVTGIFLLVNYLGFTRYQRWDLSKYNRYSLSEMTRHVLNSLKKDAHVYVLYSSRAQMPGGQALFDDLRNLLKEYQDYARRKVQVETVDLYDDVTKARLLQDRFRFGSQKNLVIVEYQNRSRTLRAEDLVEVAPNGLFENNAPEITAFKGEQVITTALLELLEEKQPRVGLVTGHGEPGLGDGSNLSRLQGLTGRQNLRLEEVNLSSLDHSPGEFAALILAGARSDFSRPEVDLLQAYWNSRGRLLVLLNARARTPLLTQFLQKLGISGNEDVLITRIKTGMQPEGLTLDVYGRFQNELPFLKSMAQATAYFPGGTTSLSLNNSQAQAAGLKATKAVTPAFPNYWGEKDDFMASGADPTFVPGRDLPPPLTVGWVLEKGAIPDQRVQVAGSRMMVLGNADFISDAALNRSAADGDFAVLILNWLTDRELLLGIPPKQPRFYSLDFSGGQLNFIFAVVVLGVPAVFGFAGFFVWLVRRR
ncbi:MAG TPA: GldG family protein [Chthoniobacterales bacterium]